MCDVEADLKRPWPTRAQALLGLCVMAVFAFSLWSSMWRPSGVALVAWILGWGIASGRVAARWPGFGWPALCAAAMLLVWLPWTLRYGQTAWQSMYVVMFAVIYLVAAGVGALLGNLLITWRSGSKAKRPEAVVRSRARSSERDSSPAGSE
ncbi:MAG: hypothetical protein R2853_14805 [Thermomicrobiales bacterium]